MVERGSGRRGGTQLSCHIGLAHCLGGVELSVGASFPILRSKFSTHIASLFTLRKTLLQPKAKPGGPGSQPYSKPVFCRENRCSMICFILKKKERKNQVGFEEWQTDRVLLEIARGRGGRAEAGCGSLARRLASWRTKKTQGKA